MRIGKHQYGHGEANLGCLDPGITTVSTLRRVLSSIGNQARACALRWTSTATRHATCCLKQHVAFKKGAMAAVHRRRLMAATCLAFGPSDGQFTIASLSLESQRQLFEVERPHVVARAVPGPDPLRSFVNIAAVARESTGTPRAVPMDAARLPTVDWPRRVLHRFCRPVLAVHRLTS